MIWNFETGDCLPVVRIGSHVEIDESAVLANCWRQSSERALAFLVAVAGSVPDHLLLDWETCYRDAEFASHLLRDRENPLIVLKPDAGKRAA